MPLDSGFWESYPTDGSDDDPRFEQVLRALKNGDTRTALDLLESMAHSGDERAALCLGFVLESEGKSDQSKYAGAEHWYKKGLINTAWPNAELGLARIYYYGLGRQRDPTKAEEHLWRAQPEKRPEAALMLATILESTYHKPTPDVGLARRFYEIAKQAGYPLAMVKLARIATGERRWWQAIRLIVRAVQIIVQLRLRDPRDSRLIGYFPKRH